MADKDTSAQIMAAARKRFAHFGYGKTTMAEVAADCTMSPGNLYRFFPGKLDIAEAIAAADFEQHLQALRRAAGRSGQALSDILRLFLFEELRRLHARAEKDPRGQELSRLIAAERPAFANRLQDRQHQVLVELIEGQNLDADFAAQMILSATMKFRHPALWSDQGLDRLEWELKGVLDLLVEGLSSPRAARALAQEQV